MGLPFNDSLSAEQDRLSNRKHRPSSVLVRKIKKPRTHSERRNHCDADDLRLLEAARAHGFTAGSGGGEESSSKNAAESDLVREYRHEHNSPVAIQVANTAVAKGSLSTGDWTVEEDEKLLEILDQCPRAKVAPSAATERKGLSKEQSQAQPAASAVVSPTEVQLSPNTWKRTVGKRKERRPTKPLADAAALGKQPSQPEASSAVGGLLDGRPSATIAAQPSSVTFQREGPSSTRARRPALARTPPSQRASMAHGLARFAEFHAAVSQALDLCCTASTVETSGSMPRRLSLLRDCNDGSVQLSLWLPHAVQMECVQLAPRALQTDWVKLHVHDGATTRTHVLLGSSGEHDLPISSRMIADDEESGAWTAMSWILASDHDEEELRAALAAIVESFWLDSCPDLELHMVDSAGTWKFSMWQPPDFSRKSNDHVQPPADETSLLRAVRRAGSAAARCSRRASAEATTVSGWHFARGNRGVQCCMHWCPDCPAAAAAHAESAEPSSIVRLLTDEPFRIGDNTPVHDAFVAVAKTWAKEFAIKLTPRNELDHTSFSFELPVVRGQAPVSGVLTVAIDSPTGNVAAGSTGTAYVRAAQYAVGQAVDALASRDILFLSQRRLRRQQFAPAIAQKLSWMLCKVGDEAILNECASALGVEYDQLAADTRAIATSHQHRDQRAAASATGGSNGEDDSMPDAGENTPHARVVSNIAAGLATHLCAQLREQCPATPDSNKVARVCRLRSHSKTTPKPAADDLWESLSQRRKAGACGHRNDALSDQEDTQKPSEAALALDNLHAQLELQQHQSISDQHPSSQKLDAAAAAADEATDIESEWSDSVTSDAEEFESDDWTDSEPPAHFEGQERRPTKPLADAAALDKQPSQLEASSVVAGLLGHIPSTAIAVQPSSETDIFESDDRSDSQPMPMNADAGVADAEDVLEPDDWSDPESAVSTSELNDQRESESEAEEGSAHWGFGEADWHVGAAAHVGSDFSSTDSDENQCDP